MNIIIILGQSKCLHPHTKDITIPVINVDVAVQVTEKLVPDSSEVAVQTSIGETLHPGKDVPCIHVGLVEQLPCPDPSPENDYKPAQEQRHQGRGMPAEQAVHAKPTVVSFVPHPRSPYPRKTHPGRYNYYCEHRCNTGRRRTNSGTRNADDRLCCDHRCPS